MSDLQFKLTGVSSLEIRASLLKVRDLITKENKALSTTLGNLELVPEPQNPYDEYAIKVIADNQYSIGYVPKHICNECGNPLTPAIIKQGSCASCATSIPKDVANNQFNQHLQGVINDYEFYIAWIEPETGNGVIIEARKKGSSIKWA